MLMTFAATDTALSEPQIGTVIHDRGVEAEVAYAKWSASHERTLQPGEKCVLYRNDQVWGIHPIPGDSEKILVRKNWMWLWPTYPDRCPSRAYLVLKRADFEKLVAVERSKNAPLPPPRVPKVVKAIENCSH